MKETVATEKVGEIEGQTALVTPQDEPLTNGEGVNQKDNAFLKKLPAQRTFEAEYEWLKKHGSEYRNQWIALRGETPLIADSELDAVMAFIETHSDEANALVLFVP